MLKKFPLEHYLNSGYHIREAGSTAIQEVAFTISNALEYVEAAVNSGLTLILSHLDCLSSSIATMTSLKKLVNSELRKLWHDLITERYNLAIQKALCFDSTRK